MKELGSMPEGKVKWFNDKKGYGFILQNDGTDVFVHYSAIEIEGYKTLTEGQSVVYEVSTGPKGLHATRVQANKADAHREAISSHA